jgi:tetratricopeptide (TPR) repeat protein
VLIIVPVSIALILRSSLSELFAGGFLRLVDPSMHDTRTFDPKASQRHQDAIARLIQQGKREEAIQLCEQLKVSGEVDIISLEHTLEYLGVKQQRAQPAPLREAAALRAQGKFAEAEARLQALLKKNPADAEAAFLLMRLYAENLQQPARAHEVLRLLQQQPHVSADHVEFARRSIDDWNRPKPAAPAAAEPPATLSVDELLAQGGLGMAVESLEEQIRSRPEDFELQLRLAEVYAVHLKNLPRAGKIVQHMERNSLFKPEQIAMAKAKLQEWQAAVNLKHG